MGRIQSSIGLITGVPIAETVDKLIAVSARPRDLLKARTDNLQKESVAIGELTANVIGVQLAAKRLNSTALFSERSVSVSESSIQVQVTGQPAPGTHHLTPIRSAQAQRWLAAGFAAADEPIGAGTLTVGFGGHVDPSVELAELNGGEGVASGKIRITDRSGASAVVDLRFAQTVDDVVAAINASDAIDVTASLEGDALRLTDNTGETEADLRVDEVSGGTTAADLGLTAINAQAGVSTALGGDLVSLHRNLALSRLNDGGGLRLVDGLDDLTVTLGTGDSVSIDLSGTSAPTTLGQVIDRINAADTRLTARIGSDGDRLELVDSSGGTGPLIVASANGSSSAEDLGLAGSSATGTLAGDRLSAGLKSTLLRTLHGGDGTGTLGVLSITNRAGTSTDVDLSSAETLDDVVRLVNAAGAGVSARVNDARNGLLVTDTSGGSGHLVLANGSDGRTTADKLRLAVDAAVASHDSGSLDRATLHENTRLSTLNHGRGIGRGSFRIVDSAGQSATVNLTIAEAETIGDVLTEINGLNLGVEARINATGDGIELVDTAGGNGVLTVTDQGRGTAARDLRIRGQATMTTTTSGTTQSIDGSATFRVTLSETDTLEDLVEKLNDLDGGFRAAIFHDGASSSPFRLALSSDISGRAGQLLLDAGDTALRFRETAAGRDALVAVGDTSGNDPVVLASSSTNTFESVLPGTRVTIQSATGTSASVTIAESSGQLANAVQTFVDQYNRLREKLDTTTTYDAGTNKSGTLFGSAESLRVEAAFASFFSGRFSGGTIRSLESLGLSLRDNGKLDFDKFEFQSRVAADPESVKQFFTAENTGFVARIDELAESLAGAENSLLVSRTVALQRRIELGNERIEFLNKSLDARRERLLNQFFQMESIIGRLQNNLTSINNIRPLSIFSSGST